MGGVEVEVGVELKANAGVTYDTVITVHNLYTHIYAQVLLHQNCSH